METEGAFRKVVCQPAPVRSPTTKNVEIKDDATVGVWGGTCTCPDGEVYLVGENLLCDLLTACVYIHILLSTDPQSPCRAAGSQVTS
eukprot:603879-Prymnesium_polylepis.3